MLGVTKFEVTNSVLNITDEDKSFSITTSNLWTPKGAEETKIKLNEISNLKFQNDFQLQVKEVEITDLMVVKEFFSSDLDSSGNKLLRNQK